MSRLKEGRFSSRVLIETEQWYIWRISRQPPTEATLRISTKFGWTGYPSRSWMNNTIGNVANWTKQFHFRGYSGTWKRWRFRWARRCCRLRKRAPVFWFVVFDCFLFEVTRDSSVSTNFGYVRGKRNSNWQTVHLTDDHATLPWHDKYSPYYASSYFSEVESAGVRSEQVRVKGNISICWCTRTLNWHQSMLSYPLELSAAGPNEKVAQVASISIGWQNCPFTGTPSWFAGVLRDLNDSVISIGETARCVSDRTCVYVLCVFSIRRIPFG